MQAPSTPLSSRGRATRQRLLTAARDVFEERGFPDTRITHITDAAGVAYGSFYTHFASKEAIFQEVASALFEEMFAPDDAPPATPRASASSMRTRSTRRATGGTPD